MMKALSKLEFILRELRDTGKLLLAAVNNRNSVLELCTGNVPAIATKLIISLNKRVSKSGVLFAEVAESALCRARLLNKASSLPSYVVGAVYFLADRGILTKPEVRACLRGLPRKVVVQAELLVKIDLPVLAIVSADNKQWRAFATIFRGILKHEAVHSNQLNKLTERGKSLKETLRLIKNMPGARLGANKAVVERLVEEARRMFGLDVYGAINIVRLILHKIPSTEIQAYATEVAELLKEQDDPLVREQLIDVFAVYHIARKLGLKAVYKSFLRNVVKEAYKANTLNKLKTFVKTNKTQVAQYAKELIMLTARGVN